MMTTTTLYEKAARRVAAIFPDDEAAQEFCLADWPDGEEHWRWLLTADRSEIEDWVAAGRA